MPPQLPEWCPPARRSTVRSKLSAPRVPPKIVGRSGASRGPSEPISRSAASMSFALGAELGQAGRADLLAGVDHERAVEAEPAALGDHHLKRQHVDQVLRLVVGGAAPVPALALDGERPRIEALAPLAFEAADDVAVAVAQHRRQAIILVPRRDEERSAMGDRVGQDLGRIAHALEGRRDLAFEIDAELRSALRHLALGAERDAAREIVAERAGIEVALGAPDGGLTAHVRLPTFEFSVPG